MVLAVATAAPDARACDSGSIRQAAFQEARDTHKLCVIGDSEDPATDTLHGDLAAQLSQTAQELNVELVRVNADDPEVQWKALALPSAPPVLPVTVLVGWDGVNRRPFLIDHWEPGPSETQFAALVRSPLRKTLKRSVLDRWAVVLYARGTDETGGGAEPVLQAVEKKWAAEYPPGITVARFDRADPHEGLVRAFIGLPPSGPDWAGVVFGQGKLMAPPLEGTAITEDNLNRLVGTLVQPCTCLQAGTSLGVDIPMIWEASLATAVVKLGDDGYLETTEAAAVPVSGRADGTAAPVATRRIPVTALIALAASALVVLLGTVAILWRSREGSATPGRS